MSSAEFTEWQAYDRLEPLLADRMQLALLTAVVANSVPKDPKKRRRVFSMADFLLQYQPPKPPPTPQELRQRIDAAMSRLGGKRTD